MKVVLLILAIIFSGMSYANHNSQLMGYDPDRNYTQEACENWTSEELDKKGNVTKNIRGQWLGHIEGCRMGDWIYQEYNIKAAPEELEV